MSPARIPVRGCDIRHITVRLRSISADHHGGSATLTVASTDMADGLRLHQLRAVLVARGIWPLERLKRIHLPMVADRIARKIRHLLTEAYLRHGDNYDAECNSAQTSVIVTAIFPRVAFEYGQMFSASATRSFWDIPLQTRQLDSQPSAEKVARVPKDQVYFGFDAAAGSTIFLSRAVIAIALSKDADQATANSCSGLVPMRADPGVESLTSSRPSELRERPFSRPPVVFAFAVYTTVAV
jgi:hypothetical protein